MKLVIDEERKENMKEILDYLLSLEMNNNRDWYQAHKKEYQQSNREFEELVQNLIFEIGKTDCSILNNVANELTFKLVRDTRFSNDKSPYNPAFRAHISSKGKLPIPVGYFIMIKPGNRSFLGGGLFADMFKDATTMIRDYIVTHGDEWQSIITDPNFMKYFTVRGEALKNVPRGYDSEHPQAEYLKNKCWYLEYPITDEQLSQDDFISKATEVFVAMQPFNHFLNCALENFEMPKR
jgi:uncharacterized protein (TIGR02453 family)